MRILILAAFSALAGCINVDVDLGTRRGRYTEKIVEGDEDAVANVALIDVQGLLTSDQDDSLFSLRESQVVGLVDKIGVKVEALKSGANKDMGSPFRGMSDEDKKLFQALIDQFYARFLAVVTEGRKGRLTEAQVKALADGRVYTAPQALEAKL